MRMAARPPSNDIDDGPDVTEFGIVALEAAIDDWDVSFPISAGELTQAYGSETIPVNATGYEMTLEAALSESQHSRFEDKQELLNALHPVFEAERQQASNSLLGQLRALLPF
jgi:hypothetical protein